ncbi:MAG: DUF1840 domain-containing protein [Azoarcus sp.]|jgi:hypothetical protein|nr:DUF1840 domain-containing protein [Azoarcus sp.]
MLTTFKSEAGADVIMFGDAARLLLAVLGKDADEAKGIVTVEQLPEAISRLQSAIDAERARQSAKSAAEREAEEEAEREAGHSGMEASVGLAQRAWPLLDLLRRAQTGGAPVVWGL